MCDSDDEAGIMGLGIGDDEVSLESAYKQMMNPTLQGYADHLTSRKQNVEHGRHQAGFVSFGNVEKGDRVLMAVSNLHDRELVDSISASLKKKGARTVDVLVIDEGEDHEVTFDDEINRIMRTVPYWEKPRWYDYQERVLNYARENGYDMVIHGRGGPMPKSDHDGNPYPFAPRKFQAIPWATKDVFLQKFAVFPPKLNFLINVKAWNKIYKQGKGGKVRLTDPEGTDVEFTLNEKYYERPLDERGGFGPIPNVGHLFGYPTPPLLKEDDVRGEVKGTISHITRPFKPVTVDVEQGKIQDIKGGEKYGEAWRELIAKTENVQYPEFPEKGLFWLWEVAIGTNPKVQRPVNSLMLSSGAYEIERSRSGIIHMGFGTRWSGSSEKWAGRNGEIYGHLHVHLMFPTYEITTKGGETVKVIENGRLTALDDPEVRELASKYGDPDELLKEDWIPSIPGISTSGKYEDYANDPADWIKKHG